MMMQNKFVLLSPEELQALVVSAVFTAVQQITFPQKIEPQPP